MEELKENKDKENKNQNIFEKLEEPINDEIENEEMIKNIEDKNIEEEIKPQKKGRGRPRKNPIQEVEETKPKRGRGRPRKNPVDEVIEKNDIVADKNEINVDTTETKKKEQTIEQEIDLFSLNENGRQQEKIDFVNMDKQKMEQEEVDLFDIDEEETEEEVDLFNIDKEETEEEVDLFNIDEAENEEEVDLFNIEQKQENDMFSRPTLSNSKEQERPQTQKIQKVNVLHSKPVQEEIQNNNYMTRINNANSNFNTLLTGDKKVVAFVGTTKNGTSFIVNNTAEMLSSMGIETAILDLTKSKNAYYIYTDDKEDLRTIARNCMENLHNGIADGIKVHKNLTVYTEMPGDEKNYDIETVLTTLLKKHSVILIDTDFDTIPEVFEKTQEIYLVQTMDVLTIQPLTAFLRNLKSKAVLQPEKLKIVINKAEKVRSLSVRTLIGGMSCYNSPSMTYMTELFDKDNIKYCEIPFEVQNYVKYLDSLVNCSITLNGYTKQFMSSLKELANMVYPLVGKQVYAPMNGRKGRKDPFSNQVNDTLNKMRNKY